MTKQVRRTIIAAAAMLLISLILLVRFAGPFAGGGRTADLEEGSVSLATLFTDEELHARLQRELTVFTERFPGVEIDHRAVPHRDLSSALHAGEPTADLVTIVNPAAFEADRFHAPPVPWSGQLWMLYFNRPVLERALGEIPPQPQNINELVALFERVHAAGLTPLALGASHGWPLTALIQHLSGALAADGGDTAWNIAAGRAAIDGPEIRRTIELLRQWRERGWISADAPQQPWTAGVRQVLAGEAAFTLLNQQFFTPVPPDRRGEIGFYAFPTPWAVGSVIYLARPSDSEDRHVVREMQRFLTSAGTVDRLSRNLARPFFGGVQDAALPDRLIPSITADPNTPYHRRLWQTAVAGIW